MWIALYPPVYCKVSCECESPFIRLFSSPCLQADPDALVSDGSEEFPHGCSDVHHAAGELWVNWDFRHLSIYSNCVGFLGLFVFLSRAFLILLTCHGSRGCNEWGCLGDALMPLLLTWERGCTSKPVFKRLCAFSLTVHRSRTDAGTSDPIVVPSHLIGGIKHLERSSLLYYTFRVLVVFILLWLLFTSLDIRSFQQVSVLSSDYTKRWYWRLLP